MIRLYSNQEKPDVVPMVDGINTNETEWWMIYDANALQVIIPPQQCSGGTSSPYTMAIADTLEELEQHIQDNGLILPVDLYGSDYPTDNIQ
jgi:hypothetical protein